MSLGCLGIQIEIANQIGIATCSIVPFVFEVDGRPGYVVNIFERKVNINSTEGLGEIDLFVFCSFLWNQRVKFQENKTLGIIILKSAEEYGICNGINILSKILIDFKFGKTLENELNVRYIRVIFI